MAKPKELAGVDPCTLLGPEQLAETSSGEGKPGESEWGEGNCEWFGALVAIALDPNTTRSGGLGQVYRGRDLFDNFATSQVDGYPSVRVNFASESCGLIVGVADDQTLHMEYTRVTDEAPGRGDSCGYAESLMAAALERIPDA